MSNTTQTSKTLDSYSKARMEIMVKDELPNLLQDIQRTYIYDFMPKQFMARIILDVIIVSKILRIMLMMTICFIIKKKNTVQYFVFS